MIYGGPNEQTNKRPATCEHGAPTASPSWRADAHSVHRRHSTDWTLADTADRHSFSVSRGGSGGSNSASSPSSLSSSGSLFLSLSLSFPPRAYLSLQGCFPLAAPPASQPAEDYFQIRRRSAYSLGALRGVGCGAIFRTISIFHLEKAAMKRPWKETHYFHIPQWIQMMIGGIVNFLSGFLNGAKRTVERCISCLPD